MSLLKKQIMMKILWTGLPEDDAGIESPAWHGEALHETERLVNAGKAKFLDLDDAIKNLRRDLSLKT